MTSCVCRRSRWMSSVCQTMRFGSGDTVPSTQSTWPFLLTRQSLGPRYRPEITTWMGATTGLAASACAAAADSAGQKSAAPARRAASREQRGMSITMARLALGSIGRRRRKGHYARRALVDACKGEFGSAAGEPQRHDELSVLRQVVALDDLGAELRLGVDHIGGFLPAGHLLRIALLSGNVALDAGRVSVRGIARGDREGVGAHADSEVIARRHVGHQLIHR